MLTAAIISFAGHLAHEITLIFAILEQEIGNGTEEFLPHIWMADVARMFCAGHFNAEERSLLLRAVDQALQDRDISLNNLVAVSFVEHLPPPIEGGFKLIEDCPTILKEYINIFGPF